MIENTSSEFFLSIETRFPEYEVLSDLSSLYDETGQSETDDENHLSNFTLLSESPLTFV